MVKQLVILGDSFCHGIGTVTPFNNKENNKYAFGQYIADYYNLEYVNLAEPGISIQRTIELGYQYLLENSTQVDKVIIGWTNTTRFGIYSDNSVLQILPEFIWLGDTSDDNVFVKYNNTTKFITNKQNEKYLKILPDLHRLMVENDFFDQEKNCYMHMNLFKTWLKNNNILYYDFSVFGNVPNTQLTVSFQQVMVPNRHPTIEEQKLLADLLLEQLP
jgi:hypothetical protein